ncbi:14379_t:CDS:1, partial [Racocetra fulgida]
DVGSKKELIERLAAQTVRKIKGKGKIPGNEEKRNKRGRDLDEYLGNL